MDLLKRLKQKVSEDSVIAPKVWQVLSPIMISEFVAAITLEAVRQNIDAPITRITIKYIVITLDVMLGAESLFVGAALFSTKLERLVLKKGCRASDGEHELEVFFALGLLLILLIVFYLLA